MRIDIFILAVIVYVAKWKYVF